MNMNIKQQLDMQARYDAQAKNDVDPNLAYIERKTGTPQQMSKPVLISRDEIAKMKRGDVVDHLDALGITEADCEGVKVGDLRDMLADAVFI